MIEATTSDENPGPPPGHRPDQIEGAQPADQAQRHDGDRRGARQRQGDAPEHLAFGGAVDARGLVEILRDRHDARDEDDRGDADAFPDVHRDHRIDREPGCDEPSRPVDAHGLECHVDRAVGRVHQFLEDDADADETDQHRKEDHRPQVSARRDPAGQQHGEGHAEHDLHRRGREPEDQRVDHALNEERFAKELREIVEADELRVEQRPAGQREIERKDRRHEEQDAVDQARGNIERIGIGRAAAARCGFRVGDGHTAPFPVKKTPPRDGTAPVVAVPSLTSSADRVAGRPCARPRRRSRRRRQRNGSPSPPRRSAAAGQGP